MVFVLAVMTLSWPFLTTDGRAGVVLAAIIAYPFQIAAFWLLIRYRDRMSAFLAIWAGGTVVRMAIIGVVAVFMTRAERVAPVPTLLALAAFFFGLLLVEPVFFKETRAGTING